MTTVPLAGSARALSRASRLQRAIHALRTEGDSRGRESFAIGLGLMIGCTPFWGVHFGLCWLVGKAFGLNRLKMYLAANVINPLILPPLFYAEVQAGSLVRRGHLLDPVVGHDHVRSRVGLRHRPGRSAVWSSA